jgi:predicted Holliday junction resolvase-like endonuclease
MPQIPDYTVSLSDLNNRMATIESDMPGKVLRTIQGNTATMKGELAEHIAYLKLHSHYDRLIALGSVVDFIGIKFDKDRESEDGHIDFIDIKTGRHSRLSQEQMKTKRLVQGGRTNFLKVKITTDPGVKPNAD